MMAPLDTTKTVPAGWSRHHASAATGGMNATVTVGDLTGVETYDPVTDDTTREYSTTYAGPARIQALRQFSHLTLIAGQQVSGRTYLVQLPFDATGVELGMRVHVTSAVNDTDLVGQDLWVVDPQYGSERFTRDAICSDDQSDISRMA